MITNNGMQLLHFPIDYSTDEEPAWNIFLWSADGLNDLADESTGGSDLYAIQFPDGQILSMGLYGLVIWTEADGVKVINDWSGYGVFGLNNAEITLPPVAVGNTVYVGIRHGGGHTLHMSLDQGLTWTASTSNLRIGDDRYNLLASPEQDSLWAISSEFFEEPGSLWETTDHGASWVRIDDGSFPSMTVRVVHDPDSLQTTYALTDHGLYVSHNRGISWQPTSMTQAVHGLAFVTQSDPDSRTLVVGTDSGVWSSADEGVNWINMSAGLLEGAYTVTYAHSQLLATGDGGYFTCNGLDCMGAAQVFPPSDGEGLIEVVEYYNTILKHYFMTGSTSEKAMLDQTAPSAGWQRTGDYFLAWPPGHSPEASNVCRFYGSEVLGPNSHFYSDTGLECRVLQEIQDATPDGQPRWNLEGWGMSVIPRAANDTQPCPENAIPVYRVYNNGFALGKDSNHRYVTKLELLDDMEADGWLVEGVAFCSPAEWH